jgi:hypothetical protein
VFSDIANDLLTTTKSSFNPDTTALSKTEKKGKKEEQSSDY